MQYAYEYNGQNVDFSKVPQASLEALLRKGVTHYLGNEQASKVTAWKQKTADERAAEAKKNGTEAAPVTDAEIEAKKAEFEAAALAAIYDGEIGAGRGPRLDPVERELRALIDQHIANTLAGNGIKFPKNRKLPAEGEVIEFANGQTRTLEQMRENVQKTHGERLKKDAEKRVKDLNAKAEKAKAEAERLAKAGPVSADTLGL
jgi:hypothetical protein